MHPAIASGGVLPSAFDKFEKGKAYYLDFTPVDPKRHSLL